jgi:hypothetical protein
MLAFSVGAVMIQHRWGRLTGERAVIADIAPQPAGAGFAEAGFQHRHRGVVGMYPFGRHDVRADGIDQRTDQPSGLAHPVSESGTIELDAGAGEAGQGSARAARGMPDEG